MHIEWEKGLKINIRLVVTGFRLYYNYSNDLCFLYVAVNAT